MDDSVLREVITAIEPLDEGARAAAIAQLGRHSEAEPWTALGGQLAGIRRRVPPPVERLAVVALAGDLGPPDAALVRSATAVSAGTAPLAVLARAVHGKLLVADVGLAVPLEAPGVLSLRVGSGSAIGEPAMDPEQAVTALQTGIALVLSLASEGLDVLVLGDLGAASRARATQVEPGLAGLAARGSFALGVTAGAILGGAAIRVPVVLDGQPGQAARALAVALAPACHDLVITVDGSGDATRATAHFLAIGVAARLLAELP